MGDCPICQGSGRTCIASHQPTPETAQMQHWVLLMRRWVLLTHRWVPCRGCGGTGSAPRPKDQEASHE